MNGHAIVFNLMFVILQKRAQARYKKYGGSRREADAVHAREAAMLALAAYQKLEAKREFPTVAAFVTFEDRRDVRQAVADTPVCAPPFKRLLRRTFVRTVSIMS